MPEARARPSVARHVRDSSDANIFNVTGQVLEFIAPEGRPDSAPTVTVYETETADDGDS